MRPRTARAKRQPRISVARQASSQQSSSNNVPIRAGTSGVRGTGGVQPNSARAAAPHTRPWHAPIPQRDCSFAAAQPGAFATASKRTSSQRQISVSGRARLRIGSRIANRSRTASANACQRARRSISTDSRQLWPVATQPAISP